MNEELVGEALALPRPGGHRHQVRVPLRPQRPAGRPLQPPRAHPPGDIISHLTWSSAVAVDRDRLVEPTGPTHPAVVQAMRLLDSQLTHPWTLGELAARLHLSPGYLLRLFKSSTECRP